MKRIALALTLLFISLPISAHASNAVTITAPSHRHLDGTFIDDKLSQELAPSGRLGQLVFLGTRYVTTWRVDPALLEDIQAMSQGYSVSGQGEGVGKDVAISWLNQFQRDIANRRVEAIVYANPSEYWVNKFFPHDRDFLLSVSGKRLSLLLNRVVGVPKNYDATNYFSLTQSQVRLLNISNSRLAASASYMDSPELENYKLSAVKVLNPSLTATARQSLSYDLAGIVNQLRGSVRVSTGKFTITSTNQKLPVTVTNDFPQQIVVDLLIHSTNERISVGDISSVTIPGKSKVQVMVPITVFTSGDSGFSITIKGRSGVVYGQTVIYPLKIAVISPIATWITGAAGVVLLGAAILQSLRRLRKGKKVGTQ